SCYGSTTTTTKNINPIPTQTTTKVITSAAKTNTGVKTTTAKKTTTTKNVNPIPTLTTTAAPNPTSTTCPVYPDLTGVTGCTYGAITCSGTKQAVCNYVDINLNTAWVITPCSTGTQCSVIGVNNILCINSGSCAGTTTKNINPIPTQTTTVAKTTTTKNINPIPTLTTTAANPTSTATCPVYPDLAGVTGCTYGTITCSGTSQAICNYVDVNYDTAYAISACGPGLQCIQIGINNVACLPSSSCSGNTVTTTTKNINPIPTQTTTKNINPIPTQTTSSTLSSCTANADLSSVTGCTYGQWACSGTQVAQCVEVDSNPLNNVYKMTACYGTDQCQVLDDIGTGDLWCGIASGCLTQYSQFDSAGYNLCIAPQPTTTASAQPNPTGLCGPDSPVPTCAVGCCSKFGYCGTDSSWCGVDSGCLTKYSSLSNGINLCLAPQPTSKAVHAIPTQGACTVYPTINNGDNCSQYSVGYATCSGDTSQSGSIAL
ncbi:hypothetical protein HDV06_002984, partial [Boothiomyces sp. JEL0866]